MEIKILKIDSPDIVKKAWEISRPKDVDSKIEDIIKIDAPILDIPSATLHVKSTILEREIFATMRDHIIWAQTSRVNDPFHWPVPEEIYHGPSLNMLYKKMKSEYDKGMSQDEYRLNLPLCLSTEYTLKISIRSLIKVWKYFKNSEVQYIRDNSNYLKLVLSEFFDSEFESIKPIDILKSPDDIESGVIGDFIVLNFKASLALRAQLIRHKLIFVRDGLADLMNDEIWNNPISTEIPIQICADKSFIKSLAEKRSCWMAQYGIWKPIMEEINKHLDLSETILPCDNKCPYDKDAELRYTSADPGSPCPKHAIITDKKVCGELHGDMINQFTNESRPEFWVKLINQVEVLK